MIYPTLTYCFYFSILHPLLDDRLTWVSEGSQKGQHPMVLFCKCHHPFVPWRLDHRSVPTSGGSTTRDPTSIQTWINRPLRIIIVSVPINLVVSDETWPT